MKLIEETFTDINGRKFRRNTVRSYGDGSFLTLDKLQNVVIASGFGTREEAWQYLRETDA
jgi:hypothetical protein